MSDPVFELVTSIEAAIATYKAAAPVEVTTFPVETTVVSPNQDVTYPTVSTPNLNRVPENAVEAAAMAASNAPIVETPMVETETKLV